MYMKRNSLEKNHNVLPIKIDIFFLPLKYVNSYKIKYFTAICNKLIVCKLKCHFQQIDKIIWTFDFIQTTFTKR